ncbi:rod shape-determining protein RodA [Desulfobacula phenolica]|uniref:Peptidoglycan glycosyltransferase RodA n=1 Tax=Desulfobacula phenolica TaxID=90732 RepID=A0A1H2G5H8_9BACT|nr:rod shape-determining protein RodA [Desulfobacula phenolica]SDU14835.1 rod shape determining protein RodA [Desulfobacula phenolica]
MFDRRLIKNFDWGLVVLIFLIGSVGLVILFSALTAGHDTGTIPVLFKKQIMWMGAGLFIIMIAVMIDFKELDKLNLFIYMFCIGLLISVILFGQIGGGSRRWLVLGPLRIQPSELMKIALIISLASVYSTSISQTGLNFRKLIKPFVLCTIPFILIVNQPDLGTGLLLLLIAGSITFFVKLERRVFFTLSGFCIAAAPLVWFVLKDYQKFRILTFLNPDRDPLGSGYHIIQSKIAIGSGMLAGKGFLKGTQNALSFLPEQHTDFIVSVLAEEWGLLGCSILLILYIFILFWGVNIAYGCRNMFGSILAFGITIMIFWQIFINIGMVMGLMPVVGVPLPLVSYGGSSVITNMVGFGILLNISMRKFSSK